VDASAVAGAPPRRFGIYRVVREVGRGGMGVVYEGTSDDESRAASPSRWRRGQAPALLEARFRLERQILSGLDHRTSPASSTAAPKRTSRISSWNSWTGCRSRVIAARDA
jgi:hypothetical protein